MSSLLIDSTILIHAVPTHTKALQLAENMLDAAFKLRSMLTAIVFYRDGKFASHFWTVLIKPLE